MNLGRRGAGDLRKYVRRVVPIVHTERSGTSQASCKLRPQTSEPSAAAAWRAAEPVAESAVDADAVGAGFNKSCATAK